MSNLLSGSTSPYLLAHADDPVDWRPWGPDAFAEARERDVPVLLSIGYSTCHWCHVMAAESFSDPAVAALLRESCVAIKVDREELPAVDSYYMDALLAMGRGGGWPLTVFARHDGAPFFAGTYFPSESSPHRASSQMPSLSQVVASIAKTWSEQRDRVDEMADQLAARLRAVITLSPDPGEAAAFDETASAAVRDSLLAELDSEHGGFGRAPKFPPHLSLLHLLTRHGRMGGSGAGGAAGEPGAGESAELAAVRLTMERIAAGGMRDQIAGGICRYSVDAAWHVPHFEKMLSDNALHLRVAAEWAVAEAGSSAAGEGETRWARLARREAEDAAAFLLEDLGLEGGGFAAGRDADSADESGRAVEGAWFLESPGDVPGPLVALAAVPELPDGEARTHVVGLSDAWDFEAPGFAEARAELRERRAGRAAPRRDDKLIAEWNAHAVVALARAAEVFGRPDWREAAERCFGALWEQLVVVEGAGGDAGKEAAGGGADGPGADAPRAPRVTVRRSATDGRPGPGTAGLGDIATLLSAACALGRRAEADVFWAALQPMLRRTPDGRLAVVESLTDGFLPARGADPFDSALPSGRSALLEALRRYADLCRGDAEPGADPTTGEPDAADPVAGSARTDDERSRASRIRARAASDLRALILAHTRKPALAAPRAMGAALAEAEHSLR